MWWMGRQDMINFWPHDSETGANFNRVRVGEQGKL